WMAARRELKSRFERIRAILLTRVGYCRYWISIRITIRPAKIGTRQSAWLLDYVQFGGKSCTLIVHDIERTGARLPVKIVTIPKATGHDLRIASIQGETEQGRASRVDFGAGIATGGFGNIKSFIRPDVNIAKPTAASTGQVLHNNLLLVCNSILVGIAQPSN